MAGYDTANRIENVQASAHSEFGADPNFWLRYFAPSPAADVVETAAVAESRGAWDSGGPRIGCICAPTQSRLSGSNAEGHADAQAFCAAIYSAYTTVTPLLLPTNGRLYCWLDQEYSTSMSLAYWNGWSGYVGGYVFAENGTAPLYACLYCAPNSPFPNCTTIGNAGANNCYAVWSSTPEPCGTLTNPPSWRAYSCAGTPTKVWQFGEQGVCGFSANVDLDVGASGFNTADYCFYLSYRP
jgi:hypothetical protein